MLLSRFYITTAIDYPNGAPHLGHLYEKLVTDTYARWYRFLGRDVFFLTGTDENGQKLATAAREAGADDTRAFVDQNSGAFRKLCADVALTNDDFIRTTEERHLVTTIKLWNALKAKDDIYFDRYSGNYCLACEAFYPDNQAEDGKCPNHGTPLKFMEEDGYFFRMSRYQQWIIDYIEGHPEFIYPSSARKEILSWLKGEELRDLSISRPNQGWGIPIPPENAHVIYTWFDALINYYTAVDQGSGREAFWPADVHVIGKDITRFHTVIWPVMLHATGITPPKQVYVHGMLLAADGRKMSKSLGNVVNPYDLIGRFQGDLLRYYLLRAVASGQDGAFSVDDLIARNNNELANDLGNLVNRVIKLTAKRMGASIDAAGVTGDFDFRETGAQMAACMDGREHHRALDVLWEAINRTNAYLNVHEPWRIKDDDKKFKQHMYNALYALHCFATLSTAFLPASSAKLFAMLGTKNTGLAGLGFGSHQFNLTEVETLFPKIE